MKEKFMDDVDDKITTADNDGAGGEGQDDRAPNTDSGAPQDDAPDGGDKSGNEEGNGEGKGWKKRVDKLTARNKTMREENDTLRQENETLKREKAERDEAQYAHLSVPSDFYTPQELARLDDLSKDADQDEADARFWWDGADSEDGKNVNGKTYTPQQCRDFARTKERTAAAKRGQCDAINSAARDKMKAEIGEYRKAKAGKPPAARGDARPPDDDDDGEDAPKAGKVVADKGLRVPDGGARPKNGGAGVPPTLPTTQEEAVAFMNS